MVGAKHGDRVTSAGGWGTAKAENTLEMYTQTRQKGQISRQRMFFMR